MTTTPHVSVIVAAYNCADTIASCIESLLHQNFPKASYDIIVVDNNSTDQTRAIIQKYPVKYILEDQIQGPAAARNRGVLEVQTPFIAFLDSDQMADPMWLTNLITGFENMDYGAFGGLNQFTKSPTPSAAYHIQVNERGVDLSDPQLNSHFNHKLGGGNSAYRKSVFDRLRGFDTNLFSSEDFDLVYRMQDQLKLKVKFNPAIVWNRLRDNKQLLKREYRIGFGHALLKVKYPQMNLGPGVGKLIWRNLGRTLTGILASLKALFQRWPFPEKKLKIQLIFLDIAVKWMNIAGRIHYSLQLNKGKIPAHW